MLFLALFKESLRLVWNALVTNRLRSFLSLLGITIGIFAVISVFTVVDSLETTLRNSVKSLGDDVVFIQKWPWTFGPDYPWWKYIKRPLPGIEDLEAVQRRSKYALASAFTVSTRRTVKRMNTSVENVEIIAASHDYNKVKTFELQEGRYFSEKESAGGANLAIIGDMIAKALFPSRSPVGEAIKIGGLKVIVIGVFKREGESILGGSPDTQVLLAVNFVRNILDIKSDKLDPYIMVKAKAGVTNEQLMDELTGIMRAVRKLQPLADDNFALNQTSLINNQFDSLFEVVGLAGWIIGGFSVLVGGFGIANIMFVSVKERTPLIGIQKSLGAKNYFILLQFLLESIVLCLIGGGIGLMLIYVMILFAGDSFGMEIALTQSNIVLGFTISVLIGVVSGFVPSYGASQLDPVEAIRVNG